MLVIIGVVATYSVIPDYTMRIVYMESKLVLELPFWDLIAFFLFTSLTVTNLNFCTCPKSDVNAQSTFPNVRLWRNCIANQKASSKESWVCTNTLVSEMRCSFAYRSSGEIPPKHSNSPHPLPLHKLCQLNFKFKWKVAYGLYPQDPCQPLLSESPPPQLKILDGTLAFQTKHNMTNFWAILCANHFRTDMLLELRPCNSHCPCILVFRSNYVQSVTPNLL